jgi:hypothetical protein
MKKFDEFYRQTTTQTVGELISEMPKHYPGDVTYQKDSGFNPVSLNNIKTYAVLAETEDYVFCFKESENKGYVFSLRELEEAKSSGSDVLPIMVVFLREGVYQNYKQAYKLRIRESFSRSSIASSWYNWYAYKYGGILSDTEHLQGGQKLWRSLIDKARSRGMNAYTISLNTNEIKKVDSSTPYEEIWSTDDSFKTKIILLTTSIQ